MTKTLDLKLHLLLYFLMGRAWRIEYEGGLYQVLSRGNQRKDISHDDRDHGTFLDVSGKVPEWLVTKPILA